MADKNALIARFNAMDEDELRSLLLESVKKLGQVQQQLAATKETSNAEREKLEQQITQLQNTQQAYRNKLGEYAGALKKHNAALAQAREQLVIKNGQISQQNKLISDYSSNRDAERRKASNIIEQARARASAIEREAEKQAEAITSEAEQARARAERRVREADAEVADKLTSANAEADNIIAMRLQQAKHDIENIETRREMSRRSAIKLNRNIITRYDSLSNDISSMIGTIGDMQSKLEEFNGDIETENFKNFDINEYVKSKVNVDDDYDILDRQHRANRKTRTRRSHAASKTYTQPKPGGKNLLDSLSEDYDYETTPKQVKRSTNITKQSTQIPTMPSSSVDDFDDDLDFEIPTINDDSDLLANINDNGSDQPSVPNGAMSFTGSFMAVGANKKASQPESTDDDFDGIDDILNDSGLDDFDELDDIDDVQPIPHIKAPETRSTRSQGPSTWLG